MAKKAGLAQQCYVHGYDLSGDVGSIRNAGSPRGLLDVTGINSSARERLMGLSDGEFAFDSFFNDASEAAHTALKGLVTTDRIALWALGGAVGDVAAWLVCKQIDYPHTRAADGSLTASVDCKAAAGTPLTWAEMLSAGKITHSSAGSSASRDDGAASSNGMEAVVEIVDTDSGTPTIIIQESSDNASSDAWATSIAFSAVASGNEPTAERKTVSGTVERYLRLTTTGSFSNCDYAVAYRRGTATDDVSL